MTYEDAQKLAEILDAADDQVEIEKLLEPLNEAFPEFRFKTTDDTWGVEVERAQ
jgi:hypothetical protein